MALILDGLDLEQIEFKLELKNDFEFFLHIGFWNCVTQPYVIRLCDWLNKNTFHSTTAESLLLLFVFTFRLVVSALTDFLSNNL